jgi:hypothetical protein
MNNKSMWHMMRAATGNGNGEEGGRQATTTTKNCIKLEQTILNK